MDPDLEREKLELEKRRLEFDIEKQKEYIRIERIKALTIFIPLILLLATFYINNYNSDLNYKRELSISQMEAVTSFKLKVAEIIMDAETPTKAYKRAKTLQSIFPEYLNDSFAKGFDPSSVAAPAKMDLALLIIDHPSQRDEIIDLWTKVYPGDSEWADKFRTNYNESTCTEQVDDSQYTEQNISIYRVNRSI
jgi:hypothetical protein